METMTDRPAKLVTREVRIPGQGRSARAADVFQTVAWRAPEPRRDRFTPANLDAQVATSEEEIPFWVIVIGGALIAALLGALLGGALAL